jgi:hypothetical protein
MELCPKTAQHMFLRFSSRGGVRTSAVVRVRCGQGGKTDLTHDVEQNDQVVGGIEIFLFSEILQTSTHSGIPVEFR